MNFIKNKMLLRSLLILCFFLLLYRFGSHTPIPFVNKDVFSAIFSEKANGLLGMYNIMNGGALSRMSVFTLGIMPYISASIIVYLLQLFNEHVKDFSRQEDGRMRIEKLKRYLTIGLVFVQSSTIATVLQSQSVNGMPLTNISGFAFYVTTFLALLAGTFSVVWIANSLTFVGFGSGVSLVIMFGILSSVPENIITVATMYQTGGLNLISVMGLLLVVAIGFVLVILFENSERRIPLIRPDRLLGSRRTYFPIKANPIGIMPPIFAAISMSMPISLMQMLGDNAPTQLLYLRSLLSHGTISYAVFYAILVFVFGVAMSSVLANPKKMSDDLNRQNAVIPSICPGEDTEKYLSKMVFSLTIISCLYLVVLCGIPEFINYYMSIPLYLGGTSILILVSTTSDMKKNIFSMLEKNTYSDIEKIILK